MFKTWISVAVLVLSSITFAQGRPDNTGVVATQPVNCAFTFTSGTKHDLTQYCVSANGNVVQFSTVADNTGTQEFLNLTGPATEGYGMCDANSFIAYWDYSTNASANWNSATAVLTSPTSVTITRTTADGVWKLVQTITEIKGAGTTFGAAKIAMALTNLSTLDRVIQINRHAYIQGGFNDYDLTQVSVFGVVPFSNGNGLASTASFVTTAFDFQVPFVMTVTGGPNPCQNIPQQGGQQKFFEGDGAIEQVFNFDIGPGKTKTAKLTYKPF